MRYMKMCIDTGTWVNVAVVRRRRTSWGKKYCLYEDEDGKEYCTVGNDPTAVRLFTGSKSFDHYVDELKEGINDNNRDS